MPQQTWLEKAEQYLISAQLLLEVGDMDSSVSRAYYATRYICLHFLDQEGLAVDRRWQHDTVISQTVNHSRNKQWLRQVVLSGQQDFPKSLLYLFDLRGNADYGRSEVSERQAQRASAFAYTLLQAVKENMP